MDIKLDLTPKQAFAHVFLTDNKTTEIGFGGGAGGGKSILGCFWVLTQALKYPGTAWLIGRRELTNLKKTTLITFFLVLKLLNIPPSRIFKMNQQTNIMHFHNGSRIFLMDMSKQPSDPLYTRFGGLELTGAFVDESNENELMAIDILKTRIGRGLNKEYNLIPKILETFNPQKNHIYYRYYRPYRDKELPKHRVFIKSLATDNYFLDERYIDQLRNADKITRERLLYGNFDYEDDPAKLFEYDQILDLFTNTVEKSKDKYITVDVARKGIDKTVIMYWEGLAMKRVWVYLKQLTNITEDRIKEKAEEYKVPRSHIIVDEDGIGGGVVDHIDGVKGFINGSSPIEIKKKKSKSVTSNYANLKSQCYFYLAARVAEAKISIYKDIPEKYKMMIIEELEQIKQADPDKDRKLAVEGKDKVKENLGRSPDFADTLMMRMMAELRTRPPFAFEFLD